jgi:hypothetical protein
VVLTFSKVKNWTETDQSLTSTKSNVKTTKQTIFLTGIFLNLFINLNLYFNSFLLYINNLNGFVNIKYEFLILLFHYSLFYSCIYHASIFKSFSIPHQVYSSIAIVLLQSSSYISNHISIVYINWTNHYLQINPESSVNSYQQNHHQYFFLFNLKLVVIFDIFI